MRRRAKCKETSPLSAHVVTTPVARKRESMQPRDSGGETAIVAADHRAGRAAGLPPIAVALSGVPPRGKGALCHEHRRSTRRCATVLEMKEGPSGSAIRSLIPSHRERLWSKATVVSVAETSGP